MAFNTIVFQEAETPDTTVSGKNVTITLPSTTGVNDGIIVVQAYASVDATDVFTDPSGFVEIANVAITSTLRVRVLGYLTVLGDAGQTFTFGLPAVSAGSKAALLAVRVTANAFGAVDNGHGNAGSGLIENIVAAAQGGGGTTNHTMPTFTTGSSSGNVMIIEVIVDRSSPASASFVWPSGVGWTSPANASVFETGGGSVSVAIAYNANAVAGSTSVGGETVVGSVSTNNAVMVTIGIRASGASTTVGVTPTFLAGVRKRIVKGPTFLASVQSGSTTSVSKNPTFLDNVAGTVGVSLTVLSNIGFSFVETIQDLANVSDGFPAVQIQETIQNTAATTDQETSVANTLRVVKSLTVLTKVLAPVSVTDFTFLANTIASATVTKSLTVVANVHRAKTNWTEPALPQIDWIEEVE